MLAGQTFSGSALADSCDQQCQIDKAKAAQAADALPLTSFYQLPRQLPPAPSGTLVRAQPTRDYTLDPEMAATRIVYHSRDSKNHDVLSSGVVLTPSASPPAGGWKVIADAHGASGVGRICAPSLMKDIWYGDYLLSLVRAGYAVVATDYTGLGLRTGPEEFLSKRAEAQDVANALPAARAAVRGLGRDWIALGHSQGGQAALAVGELMAERKQEGRADPGYRGLVALAPANHLTAMFAQNAARPEGAGIAVLTVTGAAAERPGLYPSQVLTRAAEARLGTLRNGCLNVVTASYGDLAGGKLLRAGAAQRMEPFLRENEPGTGSVAGPALIQQGDTDTIVDPSNTAKLAGRLCRKGVPVEYESYQGRDHNGVLVPSLPDTLSWISGRFGGDTPPSTCTS